MGERKAPSRDCNRAAQKCWWFLPRGERLSVTMKRRTPLNLGGGAGDLYLSGVPGCPACVRMARIYPVGNVVRLAGGPVVVRAPGAKI